MCAKSEATPADQTGDLCLKVSKRKTKKPQLDFDSRFSFFYFVVVVLFNEKTASNRKVRCHRPSHLLRHGSTKLSPSGPSRSCREDIHAGGRCVCVPERRKFWRWAILECLERDEERSDKKDK